MKVKVCGLRDIPNLIRVSEASPDYMGFIFYNGSNRFVGDEPDTQLFLNVPAHIEKVGVFVNEATGKIIEITDHYRIHTIQLHGNENPDQCNALRNSGLAVIKTFGVWRGFDFKMLTPYLDVCDFFLFDTKIKGYGGAGIRFDWELLKKYGYDKKFFLGGGVESNDSAEIKALDNEQLYCIDINSRFETAPGLKDPERIKKFICDLKEN